MSRVRHILIMPGHPDGEQRHHLHALADAYAHGAREAGHEVREVDVSRLDFPLLRSAPAWKTGPVPLALKPVQDDVRRAEHLLLLFPLWLGDMPALVHRYLYRAHSVKSLERNILGLVGIAPVHETLIGGVESMADETRRRRLGAAAG